MKKLLFLVALLTASFVSASAFNRSAISPFL